MEKYMQKIRSIVLTTKFGVFLCATGIWVQVIYSFISSKDGVQTVYITGGKIDAEVSNRVKVEGYVNVDNTVDINLSAINGYSNCFYNSYSKHPNQYYRIPVMDY